MTKETLSYSANSVARPTEIKRKLLGWLSLTLTAIYAGSRYLDQSSATTLSTACPSALKLVPPADPQFSDLSYFRSPEYKNFSVKAFGGAVRLYTPMFDDMGEVGEDPRWDVFYEYEEYLLKTFPHLKESSELVHVNTHGLVFIIEGSDPSLKPVLLMGHQDVVPVLPETASQWTYPPTSGYFDGQYIWGRGAADDKDPQMAVVEAVDKLLSQGFKPKRGLIISFGFDEEVGGPRGAKYISDYLRERFGPDSLYFIIDEGDGIKDLYGARFAVPGTGEKGGIGMTVELLTTGGHSSVPPRHTAIGIMSELVTLLEAHPYPVDLTPKNPFYDALMCYSAKGTKFPKSLADNVAKMDSNKSAKKKVLKALDDDITTRFLVSTSQATNIIFGGLKINALPEKVTIRIDHRVGYDSSLEAVKTNLLKQIKKVAKKYNLGIETDGFGALDWPVDVPSGKFVVSTQIGLHPAPKSPTSGPAWDVFAGTIKHVFEDFAIYPDAEPGISPEVNMAPSFMAGGTDTKYFWDLTKNIYRFGPGRSDKRIGWHTVDERTDIDSHVEGVAFYYALLRNVDEQDK